MKVKSLAINLLLIFLTYPYTHSMELKNSQEASRSIPQILAEKKAKEIIKLRTKTNTYKKPTPDEIDFNKVYEKILPDYLHYEEVLSHHKDKLGQSFEGLSYLMNLDEIKSKVKEIFEKMKAKGLIITPEKFEKIKDQYFWKNHTNFTRIGGADYLKRALKSKNLENVYDVPSYVIVTDDPDHIEVELWFGNSQFPIINSLKNGYIFFQKIEGNPVASWHSSMVSDLGVDSGIGYDDFSDPGNIIMDKDTHKKYIVDTEFKSFKFRAKPSLRPLLEYALERFYYLNKVGLSFTYAIDL